MTTKKQLLSKIRLNCINCMGGQPSLVHGCTSPKCQFFEFRNGKDPRPNPNKGKVVSQRIKEFGFGIASQRGLDDENQRTDPNP